MAGPGQRNSTTVILIAVCLSISGICTWYSFNLSQVSAQQIAGWMKPGIDVNVHRDAELIQQADDIIALDSQNISHRKALFEQQRASLEKLFQNQIYALKADSTRWASQRKPSNTLWVDKKLQPILSELKIIRFQRDTSIAGLVKRYKSEVDQSVNVNNRINNLLIDDAQSGLKQKQKEQRLFDQRHSFIARLMSTIAGHAILILLALGAVREILYHRNEITPLPALGPFDFQNHYSLKEVASLPVKAIGRYAINLARKWQRLLPPLEEPVIEGYLYDFQTETRIVKVKTPKTTRNSSETARNSSETACNREKKSKEQEVEAAKESAVNNGGITEDRMIRHCLNCGQQYRIRSFNQKYCSVECKSQYHANQNGGRKFNPKLYHNGRPKE
jgi:hypothetical protein